MIIIPFLHKNETLRGYMTCQVFAIHEWVIRDSNLGVFDSKVCLIPLCYKKAGSLYLITHCCSGYSCLLPSVGKTEICYLISQKLTSTCMCSAKCYTFSVMSRKYLKSNRM